MAIGSIIKEINDELPASTRLVAISKYHPAEMIREAYSAGQRIFGESRVQELQQKQAMLPSDIQWHFIGHLQTNKVKYIAPYVSLIHAVDSIKLLAEISHQAQRCGRTIPVLLQLHVAQEETKFGFTPNECLDMLEQGEWKEYSGARITGLMCMASNTDNETLIEKEFATALDTFNTAKQQFFNDDPLFSQRSWGMSDDYRIACRQGATLIRIGSKIFGPRQY